MPALQTFLLFIATAVAEIVGDIATASLEQSSGIEQVNKALAQMD